MTYHNSMEDPPCPECKSKMILKNDGLGDYWLCTRCHYSRRLGEFKIKCSKCGGILECQAVSPNNSIEEGVMTISVGVEVLNLYDHEGCFPE